MQDAERTFELATRLEGNGNALTSKPDKTSVLPVFLAFVVVWTNTVQQRLDTVFLVIVHGGIVTVVHRQVFDLHTEATGSTALATGFEKLDQAFHMLRVRLGQQVRIRNSWCCHDGHPNENRHPQRRNRYMENR